MDLTSYFPSARTLPNHPPTDLLPRQPFIIPPTIPLSTPSPPPHLTTHLTFIFLTIHALTSPSFNSPYPFTHLFPSSTLPVAHFTQVMVHPFPLFPIPLPSSHLSSPPFTFPQEPRHVILRYVTQVAESSCAVICLLLVSVLSRYRVLSLSGECGSRFPLLWNGLRISLLFV